jgi:hypothetical protein
MPRRRAAPPHCPPLHRGLELSRLQAELWAHAYPVVAPVLRRPLPAEGRPDRQGATARRRSPPAVCGGLGA